MPPQPLYDYTNHQHRSHLFDGFSSSQQACPKANGRTKAVPATPMATFDAQLAATQLRGSGRPHELSLAASIGPAPQTTTNKRKSTGKGRFRNLLTAIFTSSSSSSANKSKHRASITNTATPTSGLLASQSFHQKHHHNANTFHHYPQSSPTTRTLMQQQKAPFATELQYSPFTTNLSKATGQKLAPNTLKSPKIASSNSLKRIRSSQLTAQQTSYEAMRTIDMYLIRQIARSCMNFELEQKIELEIRLRELACQSLLEARDELDVLEVEKALLASDQRMNCYASQLEQQRKKLAASNASTSSASASNSNWHRQVSSSSAGGNRRQHQKGTSASATAAPSVMSDSGRSSPIGAHSGPTTNGHDVIGQPKQVDHTYLSISDVLCGGSGNPSPPVSKLSPVSGQSASSANTQPSASSGRGSIGRTASRSRTNPMRKQQLQQSSSDAAQQNADHDGQSCQNGASKISNARISSHQTQKSTTMKRAKLLFQQHITQASNINCNIVTNNRATLSISELRIPLMWRDVDHFKGRGDYRRYATFCLLKIDSQIYDTRLISDVDRQMTDVNFDDVIVFHDVEHDFELTLEVYSCVYLEEFSLSSTPRKLKEKLSNSVGRAMGRRLANQTASSNYTRELETYQDKSYRFTMIASAKFRLDDAHDTVKTYDLVLVSPAAHHRRPNSISAGYPQMQQTSMTFARGKQPHQLAWSPWASAAAGHQQQPSQHLLTNATSGNQRDSHKNTLPLFGHFCCKLTVRPDVFDKCVKAGYLRVARIELPSPNALAEQINSGGSPTGSMANDAASTTPDSAASAEHIQSQSPTSSPQSTLMIRSALAASSKLASMSLQTARVHWALLKNFTLQLWPIDERRLDNAIRRGQAPQVDISRHPPYTINIDKFTRLLRVSNSSLTIETDRGCFVIAVFDPNTAIMTGDYRFITQQQHNQQVCDDLSHWLRPIEQLIYDSHIWASVLNHHQQQRRTVAAVSATAPHGSLTLTTQQQREQGLHTSAQL